MTATAIGARIKDLRTIAELSQRDLDGRIKGRVSYAYLSRIEAGTRNPSWSALAKIADTLDRDFGKNHVVTYRTVSFVRS